MALKKCSHVLCPGLPPPSPACGGTGLERWQSSGQVSRAKHGSTYPSMKCSYFISRLVSGDCSLPFKSRPAHQTHFRAIAAMGDAVCLRQQSPPPKKQPPPCGSPFTEAQAHRHRESWVVQSVRRTVQASRDAHAQWASGSRAALAMPALSHLPPASPSIRFAEGDVVLARRPDAHDTIPIPQF